MSVLVITGGTGSLGKAIIAEQSLLEEKGITKIRVISRDEQKQVALMRSYKGRLQLDCYLGDVADKERMEFALKDADFVIHAAAQKHIDKFELDVPQGYRTNILGTMNVAEAFLKSKNAKAGVLVSTDKAYQPITSYGVSKLAAEHSWLWNNTYQKEVAFSVARYGNIFGSRGSVIETWGELAKKGLTLSVTDDKCTRFFMMINEAAKFVLGCLGKKDRFIPTMKASKMVDVAETIWSVYQPDKALNYQLTGMRSIEKVHEGLSDTLPQSNEAEQFTKDELREMFLLWLDVLRK